MSKKWTVEEFNKLTMEQQLVEIAKANLREFGTIAPPADAKFIVQTRTCPHCKRTGPVLQMFGLKVQRGRTLAHSWCNDCRSSPDAHPTRNGMPLKGKSVDLKALDFSKVSPETAREIARLVEQANEKK